MLWLAVTPDNFELPICVEESAEALARRLSVNVISIHKQIRRRNRGETADVSGVRSNGRQQTYRYYKVEECEDE